MAEPGGGALEVDGTPEALKEVSLARAAFLARESRLADAENVLSVVLAAWPDDVRARDLHARLLVLLERRSEAERIWRTLLEEDSANGAAAECLRALKSVRECGPKRFRAVAVCAFVLIASAGGIAWYSASHRDGRGPLPGGRSDSTPMSERASELVAPITEVQGANWSRDGRGWRVTFDEDLFGRGAVLTSVGRARLVAFGHTIRSQANRARIVVSGSTDAVPLRAGSPYANGRSLALHRAAVVYWLLHQEAAIPMESLVIESVDVPQESRDGRRSVTITVTSAPEKQQRSASTTSEGDRTLPER